MLGAIIFLIVVGFLVGLIARAIVPGDDAMGIGGTILLGIVGSFVGAFLLNALFRPDNGDDVGVMWWVGSVLGGVLVLLLWRAATSRRGLRA